MTDIWREPKSLQTTAWQESVVWSLSAMCFSGPLPCPDLCHVSVWLFAVAICLPCVYQAHHRGQNVCRVPAWHGTRKMQCLSCSMPRWHTVDVLTTVAPCFPVVLPTCNKVIDDAGYTYMRLLLIIGESCRALPPLSNHHY
jgi:hypothetical protein